MNNFKIVRAVAVLAALGFGVWCSSANAADTPEALAGTKTVTSEEAQKLQSAGAVVVDTRVASEYSDGHIKGAISIPYREKSDKVENFDASQDEFAVNKLPADKNAPIVMYCNGPSCWKSYKAAVLAVKAGYKNINRLREGFPAWQAKKLPTE